MVNPFTEHKWKSACGKTLKAITPVIATVMLMLITVGMVGVTYAWFSNMMTTNTEKVLTIPTGGAMCLNNEIQVFGLNLGTTSSIIESDIIIATVDGADILNSPFFGDTLQNLTGEWKFDDASGIVAKDSSSAGNNGILSGFEFTPNSGWSADCVSGGCLRFDGANDNVKADWTDRTVAEHTIMGWFNTDDEYRWQDAVGFVMASDNTKLHFTSPAGPVSYYSIFGDGTLNAKTKPSIGKWYHVAVSYNPADSKARIYVNGYLENEMALSGNILSDGVEIGDGHGSEWFKGRIDNVRIFNASKGSLNIVPGRGGKIISNFPSNTSSHTVKIGTRAGISEAKVICK